MALLEGVELFFGFIIVVKWLMSGFSITYNEGEVLKRGSDYVLLIDFFLFLLNKLFSFLVDSTSNNLLFYYYYFAATAAATGYTVHLNWELLCC